ncbi:MAG TPA: MarR family transcriptional regulator [Caulifigura sp.]|jgi:MarR family transcriptional regulator for hemolysin|nr:MarR family transcriptional regulator [Caulifigura sp.]
MLQYDFQSSLGYWICMTSRAYERAMQQQLVPAGITHRQCQVLCWLAHDGPLSQVELAERMSIEPPTLVRILDRMERDGLLIREACENDRRVKKIRVLPKAKPVWKKIIQCAERVRGQAERSLTAAQRETLKELLAIVQSNLDNPSPVWVNSRPVAENRGQTSRRRAESDVPA